MKQILKSIIYGCFGSGVFIATSMVFIAFSTKQINEYWLILPAIVGYIIGMLESTTADNNATPPKALNRLKNTSK